VSVKSDGNRIAVSLIYIISLSASEDTPAEYGSCPEDEYIGLGCTIDSVTVEGCRKDRNSKACKVKRNVRAAINIEFTPDFEGENITMMAYALFPGMEKSFPDMDPNACNYTACPVVKGNKQTYTLGMKLSSGYPIGLFNARFLLKQSGEPKCCFLTKFRIEK